MKNDPIKLNRNEWELLKEFQKAPFKKRFSEILEQERNLFTSRD